MNLHSCVSIVESSLQTKIKEKSICESGVHTTKEKTFPSNKKKGICESEIHKTKEKTIPFKQKEKKVFVKVGSTRLKKI